MKINICKKNKLNLTPSLKKSQTFLKMENKHKDKKQTTKKLSTDCSVSLVILKSN